MFKCCTTRWFETSKSAAPFTILLFNYLLTPAVQCKLEMSDPSWKDALNDALATSFRKEGELKFKCVHCGSEVQQRTRHLCSAKCYKARSEARSVHVRPYTRLQASQAGLDGSPPALVGASHSQACDDLPGPSGGATPRAPLPRAPSRWPLWTGGRGSQQLRTPPAAML